MKAVLLHALCRLRSRPGRALLAAGGIFAAAAMLGAAVTVGYSLGTGFDRAASAADLADVVARFETRRLSEVWTKGARPPERRGGLVPARARGYAHSGA